MKKFSFNRKRKVRPALYHGLAICLLSMVYIGCPNNGDGHSDENELVPASTPYTLEYAHLQFRNCENANNYYQGVIGIKDNGGPIQETDIIDVRMTDSGGSIVNTETEGFYHQTFMLLDCMSGTCAQSGPFEDTGIWGRFSMLPEDTYLIEIDMENNQILSTSCDYQGKFELPYVSSTDMLVDWNDGALVLSWDNPVTDPAWKIVDQLCINVFDNNDNVVLRVNMLPSASTVTIPAALVSDAATLLGGDSLAQWLVRTHVREANMNFARGYSSRISIPPPNVITPGKWSGTAEFGDIEFEVTSDSTGISKISYNLLDYTCGSITYNGSLTTSFIIPLPIVNNQIDHDIEIGSSSYLTIDGIFDTSGDNISGNFELENPTKLCPGTWDAQPTTSN